MTLSADEHTQSAEAFRFLGHTDLGGRSDGCQVMVQNGHAYVAHVFSGGFTVVDVRDPRDPRPVHFEPTPPNTWSIHLQAHGDTLLVINEFEFYRLYQKESEYYGRSINEVDSTDFASGIRIFDISDPAKPRETGFLPVDGKGVHRIWWDGGRYAYASIMPWGFSDHIFAVFDFADLSDPHEVGRWWVPGMWLAGGEKPPWTNRWALHHAVVAEDIAYCGWRDGGLFLLDVHDPGHPAEIGHINWCPPFGGGTHSGMPLPSRKLCLAPDEAVADNCADGVKRIWMVDVSVPSNPVSISTLPNPIDQDYCNKGGHFGPHNVHENRKGSFQSDEIIFGTYQNAGLRVFDTTDQFAPREIGHYVPNEPAAWTDYRPDRPPAVHTTDVYVARDGIAYLTDFSGGGLHIVEYTNS